MKAERLSKGICQFGDFLLTAFGFWIWRVSDLMLVALRWILLGNRLWRGRGII